jgi:hypothetical protein
MKAHDGKVISDSRPGETGCKQLPAATWCKDLFRNTDSRHDSPKRRAIEVVAHGRIGLPASLSDFFQGMDFELGSGEHSALRFFPSVERTADPFAIFEFQRQTLVHKTTAVDLSNLSRLSLHKGEGAPAFTICDSVDGYAEASWLAGTRKTPLMLARFRTQI